MIRGPNGEIQRAAFARYFVRMHDSSPDEEALVDDKHLRRDRKVFTKQNLRAFLKHSLQREAWIGAPWLVKEHLAIQYRLPMEIPAHLLQDAKLLASKVRPRLHGPCEDLSNAIQQQMLQTKQPRKRTKNFSQDELKRIQAEEMQRTGAQSPGTTVQPEPSQPAAPVIKYPIEDLDIAPNRNGVVRPALEFFTDEMAAYVRNGRNQPLNDITMESMGMLLEVWNTLNVQCEVYVLDSFTFDDFCDAMRYKSRDVPCELLEEMYCAVLKLLVDEEGDVTLAKNILPEKPDADDSSDEQPDESGASTPLPEVPARSTRSRLSQVETVADMVERAHRAIEVPGAQDWEARAGARDFSNGGWQIVLVGLLHRLSLSPIWKERADKILAWLAPIETIPDSQTPRIRFATMDINLRILALQMITMLSISSPAIKNFLETSSEDMTGERKKKIELQKKKRQLAEELQIKDRERKILLPDNMLPDSPEQVSVEPVSINGDDDTIEVNGMMSSDGDDDEPSTGRSLRRGNDRKRKREEEAIRVAEEKKRAELAKQQPKQSKEFRKVLADIEELKKNIHTTESDIQDCDRNLREANVQRTKVLGRDRFCNRYYWFERNGQPFGGLPRSSTSHYGYANGRIWVQGPDELEKSGLIDRTPEDQEEYQRQFNLTVPERRALEEGSTMLQSAHEWGYYDDPVLLDNLIGWLDDRGEREKRLRKELLEWRDTIVQYMEAHKSFKDEEAARRMEVDEEHATRISTRHRAHEGQSASRQRCLKWTNGLAMEYLGHLHSESVVRSKSKRKVALHPAKGLAVPVNRHGKPVTRQGV